MKFYRYEDERAESFGLSGSLFPCQARVKMVVFDLVKETPKGYWIRKHTGINPSVYLAKKRWISATSRKRYAYPTKKEAMVSFKARKNAQIKILRGSLEQAEDALNKANNMEI